MNKTVITFKGITSDRRIVCRNITIENDYEVIPPQRWHGVDLPATSIESQVIDELDRSDKSKIMDDYDFVMILDYWPKRPRKKKVDEIAEFMTYCSPLFIKNPSLERGFKAIVSEYKDSLFGKRKSNKTKLEEVLKIHEMVLKATLGTMNMIEKMLVGDDKNLLEG